MSLAALFRFVPTAPRSRPERLAALLGLVWSLLVAAFYWIGFFDGIEDGLVDWEQTFLASSAPGDGFAEIAISRVPSDRPWPWPRLDYALVLRGLVPMHPQSVVFEMLMHDDDPRFSSFDPSFRTLVERTDTVVFAAAAMQPADSVPLPDGIAALQDKGTPGRSHLAAFGSFLWPVATFAAGSPVGVANFSSDPGQTLRRVPLLFRLRERLVPSLALAAAATRIGADLNKSEFLPGHAIVLRDGAGRALRRIPIDHEGRLRLRYRKPGIDPLRINYDDFLLYADQRERGVAPAVDLRRLNGRQVWVGATDPSVSEPVRTAVGPQMPVDIQLQAVSQIVRGDFVAEVPRSLVAILFVVTGMLLSYAAEQLSPVRALGLVAGVAAAIFVCGVGAFAAANVSFPLVQLLVLAAGIVLCSRAARVWEFRPEAPAASLFTSEVGDAEEDEQRDPK